MAQEPIHDFAGVPLMTPVRRTTAAPTVVTAVPNEVIGRNAAEEPVPLGSPTMMKVVSPDVQAQRDAGYARNEQERLLRELRAKDERNMTVLGRVFRKLTISIVLVFAGLGVLLIWTQLIQAIAVIASWSFLPWISAIVTLSVAALLILASVSRLIWLAAKFRRNRPVTRMLLERRENMREVAQRFGGEAKSQLAQYMRDYPLEDATHEAFLRKCGVTDADFNSMRRNQSSLLDDNNRQDSESWQRTFESSYLDPVDRAAKQIIRECSLLTAIKTAVCPFALLDMAVVVYMGMGMLGSLCRVYQLRAGPLDTVYLFGLVMGQAFFSGQAEEYSDEIETWVDGTMNAFGASIPGLAENIPFAGKMVGKLAAKGSQGLANGLLLNRIGKEACKMLRPLN